MAWRLTAFGLFAWALAHFGLVLLALAPWRPFPASLHDAASAYVDPVFRQTWWLFAPHPPFSDRSIHVRGLYLEGTELQTTTWLPLTDPLIEAIQANRLSSHDAALSVLLHAMYVLTQSGLPDLGPNTRQAVISRWSEVQNQPASLIVLERAGSATLRARYPELSFRQVQVRLSLRRIPSFAERDRPPGEPYVEIDFPPVPFSEDVASWSPER